MALGAKQYLLIGYMERITEVQSARLLGSFSHHLEGLIDVESLLTLRVNHPEDFLDVAGHLAKFFLRGLQSIGGCALCSVKLA